MQLTFNDKHRIEIEPGEFTRTSRQWTIHPKYDKNNGNNYDLCLVQLDRPINLVTDIPCFMDDFDAKEHHGASCWVAGWGASRYEGPSERRLQSVGLNLMDIDFCRTHSFFDSHILQSDELCAGLPPHDQSSYNIYDERVIDATKDSCQGLGYMKDRSNGF